MRFLLHINILAPIFKHMWAMWGNVSKDEVITCKKMVEQGTPLIKNHKIFFQKLYIILVQPQECLIVTRMTIQTKQDLVMGINHDPRHKDILWNNQFPFIKCGCTKSNSTFGCIGVMMRFDHYIWYVFSNLHMFFPNSQFPLPCAFGTWLTITMRQGVIASIFFYFDKGDDNLGY